MAEVKMNADGLIGLDYDSRRYISAPAWPVGLDLAASQHRSDLKSTTSPLQATCHAYDPAAHGHALMPDWGFQQLQPHLQYATTQATAAETPFTTAYNVSLQPSPMDLMAVGDQMGSNLLAASYLPIAQVDMVPYTWPEFQPDLTTFAPMDGLADMYQSHHLPDSSSPTDTYLEVRSYTGSTSDQSWTLIDNRQSMEGYNDPSVFINPNQTLHNRTFSDSSFSDLDHNPRGSFGSYVEIQHPLSSPSSSESNLESEYNAALQRRVSADVTSLASSSPPVAVSPIAVTRPVPVPAARKQITKQITTTGTTGSSRSPKQTAGGSPPSRKTSRKSPIAARNSDTKVRKQSDTNKPEKEKRVGKRKGPLRPEQRKQASEIRKLRACLRCKFLKKTCDKGEPCAGCQPSHARLWQVPCTRIDIKEIGYFLKDWKADYERHVTLGFSVGNITGFSDVERTLFITHGYGQVLPVKAREVYVHDENCFKLDWVEALERDPSNFELKTAKLSAGMEGISTAMLSDYLDRHIDGNGSFEKFVDDYFSGTPFLTQMLKTAFRFYFRTKMPVIRKALKLILAYNLTVHVTMVEGVGDLDDFVGKVDDENSRYNGKIMAPVMINFQVKCALANMWRDLQKDVLEELSALYSSVYSGEKLKNWPTIFMLASILLAVWEEMQFDCHYRVPDEAAVNKFCSDMETTPVGVIVGLFQAISQKLPAFTDWDSEEHHHLLNSNPDVCKAMTEVREHVLQHETYLRSRANLKFNRNDFDCLSNKFLSRLVLRTNQATREPIHAM